MKIEAGKYYKTRDGRKVGPIERNEARGLNEPWPFKFGDDFFGLDGKSCTKSDEFGSSFGNNMIYSRDIVSQWQDEPTSPIRTVTRREIVPGKYGIVTIKECGFIHINTMGTPDNLREAAHLLNQIAEALEENGE